MILARVQLDAVTTPPEEVLRAGTRRPAHTREVLAGLATLVASYANGRTLVAAIDDDGRWRCDRAPRVAALLNLYFGADFETTAYYSPDHRSVEVARDVAYALGGRLLGEVLSTEADDETADGVVF